MNTFEKLYSVFAVVSAFCLILCLFIYPELRQLNRLLIVSTLGFFINIGLMFIVLRDIFARNFKSQMIKFSWVAIILIFWPAVLFYLPTYGFKTRRE